MIEDNYNDFDSEVSEADFNDIFEDEYSDTDNYFDTSDYHHASESDFNQEFDDSEELESTLSDEIDTALFDQIIEHLTDEIEDLSPNEAYDHVAEAWPALIPLITAIAPSVIQAATQLAPVAVKAAGSLIGGGSRRRTGRPRRRPHRKTIHSRQRLTHIKPAPAPRCQCQSRPSSGGTLAGLGQSALGTLSSLLGNKNVQGILGNLAQKGISQALKLGNSEAIADETALLETIEYLAREAQYEVESSGYDNYSDYLIDETGNYIDNIDSPEARAERFIQLFEN